MQVVRKVQHTHVHVLHWLVHQVAAAISPLHSSLAAVQQRLEELSETKQVCA
jgi:hypothetical protein